MKEVDDLLEVLDKLLGPNGCPWDRQQTLASMRSSPLEEVCEVIEAIDLDDNAKIAEELGDLFFNACFLCRMAEKEKRFTMKEVLLAITEKLVRRHPHVFGDTEVGDAQEVVTRWEEIKRAEPGNGGRKSVLDGIPKGLPALARAQKVVKKATKAGYEQWAKAEEASFSSEEQLGNELLTLVVQAQASGLDAEHALRSVLAKGEQAFLAWEKKRRR